VSARWSLGLAAAAAAVAVVAALLATDVLRLQAAISGGDVRLRATPERSNLWQAPEILPFGTARALLGVGDDLAYRQAVREFQVGRPWIGALPKARLLEVRQQAEFHLGEVLRSDSDRKRRSAAANLIGVLGFVRATQNDNIDVSSLRRTIAVLRQAIVLDPTNADAKHNLELSLGRLRRAKVGTGSVPSPAEANSLAGTIRGTTGGANEGKDNSGY
jgi:hypothetical protein